MTIGKSFELLFSSFSVVTVTVWIIGLALVILEFYQPMRGICAGLGTACLIAACALFAIWTESVGVCFCYAFITVCVLFAVHIVMIITQKGRWLKVAASKNGGKYTKNFVGFVNREGVAITDINPTGHVSVDGTHIFVTSDVSLSVGDRVKISRVTDDKIYVVPKSEDITDNLIE